MSKAVLISIQPKWVEKIARGEKTIEVRKSYPKLETPFKVYIYETKGKQVEKLSGCDITYYGRGKVIGEFVCYEIEPITEWDLRYCNDEYGDSIFEKETCVNKDELLRYKGKNDLLYGWHISDLTIYDKPKELSEFWTVKCTNKRNGCIGCEVKPNCIKTITRPPQSWCYVEVEE